MIEDDLSALRSRTVEQFCDLMEFKAFTDFAYLISSETVATNEGGVAGTVIAYGDSGPHLGVANRRIETRDLPRHIQAAKDGYFLPLVHQHQVSLFEHILFDVLRAVLLNQPIRLASERKIEYSVIVAAPSKAEILEAMVDRELNELKYKTVSDWFVFIQKLVSSCTVAADDIGRIAEAKASRDVIVHNGGVVNEIYIRKAAAWARFTLASP